MAGIFHANSIIADSTVSSSSSPPRPVPDDVLDSSASTLIEPPLKAKRVARTYGRPKADLDPGNTDDDPGSRARILRTAPRDADDQIIPASDEADDGPSEFVGFAWRAKLKEIDDDIDESGKRVTTQLAANASTIQDDDASITRQNDGALFQTSSESSLSSLSHLSLVGPNEKTPNTMPAEPAVTDSLFDGSLSSLLSSGPVTRSLPFSRNFPLYSHDELEESAPLPKRRASHKRIIGSPEPSDPDNVSPQHPYPINSPKHQSSPTPPTSPLAGELSLHAATTSGDESTGSVVRSRKSGEIKKDKVKDKGKGKERRTKAPTKKEVFETQKESARLLADRHVSIQRAQTHSKHTVASLFTKLRPTPTLGKEDSDPITYFSSPGNVFHTTPNASSDDASPVKPGYQTMNVPRLKSKPATIHSSHIPSTESHDVTLVEDEEADEDMPELDTVLREDEEKRLEQLRVQKERVDAEKRAKDLEAQKRKALAVRLYSGNRTAAGVNPFEKSDSDDDLEIEGLVGLPQSADAPRDKDAKPLVVKSQTILNDRGGGRGTPSRSHVVSQKSLELAARPTFMAKKNAKRKGGRDNSISQQDLNSLILQRADEQSGVIEEKKKEQWVKAGGSLKDQRHVDTGERSITDWLRKGATREDAMEVDGDEDEDANDPEYTPEGVGRHETDESDGEVEEAAPDDEPVLEQPIDISDEEADADKENHRPAPRRQVARAIVDSDEEDEDRYISLRPVVLVPDTSFTEEDEEESPGEDKENSARLAFNLSEDKENAKVPRHQPRGRVISADTQGRDTSPPPVLQAMEASREPLSALDVEGDSALMPPPLAQRRDHRVLQVLHEEDRDATLAPVTSARKGTPRHCSSSPSLPASDDESAGGLKSVDTGGFSQLFAGGNAGDAEEPGPGSALAEGGFSQFFLQGQREGDVFQESTLNGRARTLFDQQQSRSELEARQEGFEFTQPNALLPSVRISESQRRDIDDMFGKDQEFKLDEARRSREEAQVESSGVLGTLNFGSFTPSQPTQLSPHSIRRPLETLSLDSGDADTELDESLGARPSRQGRLLRERPPARQTVESSPSPPPRRNAFDVLRDATTKKARERPPKQKLDKSEYVEAEAQESDEEAMLGFGGAKGDDDEEAGDEDPDAVVEDLVDDAAMDDNVQAIERVLEKHMEHKAADDAALEKLHQDAVDGKLRGKRRDRGIGFEDSDSDDDESRGPRKPLNKKRRIEGDTLDAYGEIPETRPFYNAYQADLAEDDDPTLAYLQEQHSRPMQDKMDDSSGEDSTEAIAPAEVRRRIQEMKQDETLVGPELDPESVDWVDPAEEEDQEMGDGLRFEDGPLHRRKPAAGSHPVFDHVDYQGIFKGKQTQAGEQVQLKTWASQEARAHSSASGRGGFSRKEEAGGHSRRRGRMPVTTKGSTSSGDPRALTKTSSLMSRVGKRKGFDSQL